MKKRKKKKRLIYKAKLNSYSKEDYFPEGKKDSGANTLLEIIGNLHRVDQNSAINLIKIIIYAIGARSHLKSRFLINIYQYR